MAWAFVASTYGTYSAGGAGSTTHDAVATLDIEVGDLLVATGRYYAPGETTINFAEDGGNNSFTMIGLLSNGLRRMDTGYVIVSQANDAATIRMTLSVGEQYRSFVVMQFRPDSGDTVSYEAGPGDATDTGTALATGQISTTGTDELVVVCCQEGGGALSNLEVGGGAADGSQGGDALATAYSAEWYEIFTSAQTDIIGEATIGSSQGWCARILAFKSTAPSGGSIVPKLMFYYQRLRS